MLNKKKIAALSVVLLLTISGCLTITTEATVNSDGGIDEYTIAMDMEDQVYNYFLQDSRESGYDGVEEYLRDETTPDDINISEVEVDSGHTEREDGSHRVYVSYSEIPSDEINSDRISVTEETITYSHEDPFNLGDEGEDVEDEESDFSEYQSQVELEYIVNMPGEIIETNAHDVSEDETTAEWTYLLSDDREDIYVESNRPSGLVDSVPLTPVPVVLAILLFMTIAVKRDTE